MISVCIPVFNVDVRNLAESLSVQAKKLSSEGIPVEIIFLDDCSGEEYRKLNSALIPAPEGTIERGKQLDQTGPTNSFIYHELENNIGRSAIRNRFTEFASQENLLFMDCDSVIISENYLKKYAEAVGQFPGEVICGGRVYSVKAPARNQCLQWKYGTLKESQSADTRKKDPNRSFMTNNFLVPLNILKEIRFDERLSGYGHEDSLFGYELSKKGFEIIHIENPVLHGQLETNKEFLNKTREAVRNLVLIIRLSDNDPGLMDSIKLVQVAGKLKRRGLAGIIRLMLALINPISRLLLQNGCSSLKLLDSYKLGLFLKEARKDP